MAMLDLKKWIAKITGQVDKVITPTATYVAKSVTASRSVGNFSTGTLITLQPYTKYLLVGTGSVNNSATIQQYSVLSKVSGTPVNFKAWGNQPYATSGGSHFSIGYCETSSGTVTVGVTGYIYTAGSYTHSASAIPLMQTKV